MIMALTSFLKLLSRLVVLVAFLRASLPLINGVCTFFASRFAPGFGPKGQNVSIGSVVGPDEPAGMHDDDVYTNAVGSETLKFCVQAANILNQSSAPMVARWAVRRSPQHCSAIEV